MAKALHRNFIQNLQQYTQSLTKWNENQLIWRELEENREFTEFVMKTALTDLIWPAVAVGISIVYSSPAVAASITRATVSGTAPYVVYGSNATNTFVISNTTSNIQLALTGSATSPTGNIELASNSETTGFNFSTFASLSGNIGGQSITLSSLTFKDWFGNGSTAYQLTSPTNLATKWFNAFIQKAGYGAAVGTSTAASFYNQFLSLGGFQATSDPNISYVNQDDTSGVIKIGLAGYYDLKAAYASNPTFASFAALLPQGFQASEVVKYRYNGKTNYLYGFLATPSGFTNSSHSGNYEVAFQGIKPTTTSTTSTLTAKFATLQAVNQPANDVPEPSLVLGLMALGGVLLSQKKLRSWVGLRETQLPFNRRCILDALGYHLTTYQFIMYPHGYL